MEADFESWVAFVFGHPVAEQAWHWDYHGEDRVPPTAQTLQLVSQLFEQSAPAVGHFSDAQLNQGFWFLLGSNSDAMRALADETIAWELRERSIRSFVPLFTDLFSPRCTSHLSHLDRPGTERARGMSPLNSACYMWWDFNCWCPRPENAAHHKLDAVFLEVMRQTLALPNDACRESALHGLGHWHYGYPAEAERTVDEFLKRQEPISDELRSYAEQARRGYVL